MDFTFRPIQQWPGKLTAKRARAKFKSPYTATLRDLDRELRHLAARSVVLQVALSADDIRLDGRPRANSRTAHPGVILSFESRYGPLSYPCDTFDQWEDNLRAIALALEALRTVKRYGVGQSGEQYRGWSALPPGRPVEPKMARNDAARELYANSRKHAASVTLAEILSSDDLAKTAYRAAVMTTHPDRGGDAEAFKRVQEAAAVLGIK